MLLHQSLDRFHDFVPQTPPCGIESVMNRTMSHIGITNQPSSDIEAPIHVGLVRGATKCNHDLITRFIETGVRLQWFLINDLIDLESRNFIGASAVSLFDM